MIVYISIGNSDNKLTQKEWAAFVSNIDDDIANSRAGVHGFWSSVSHHPWQNACWCIEFEEKSQLFGEIVVNKLKDNLIQLARTYGQDSIAWAEVKETEFLG
jgi:hypothetical protein